MAQPGLVMSNYAVNQCTTFLQSLLNAPAVYLRLYGNDFVPTPASVLSNFTESNFTGYNAILLAGKFGPVTKVTDGEYETDSPVFVFVCTSGGPQLVYGCYISDGANLITSINFGSPVTMQAGSSFTVQISPQGWSLVLVP
jgi:hypothetical protein